MSAPSNLDDHKIYMIIRTVRKIEILKKEDHKLTDLEQDLYEPTDIPLRGFKNYYKEEPR